MKTEIFRKPYRRIHIHHIHRQSTSVTLAIRPFDFAHGTVPFGAAHCANGWPHDYLHPNCYFSHSFLASAVSQYNWHRLIASHAPASFDLCRPLCSYYRHRSWFSCAWAAAVPVAECQRIRAVAFGGAAMDYGGRVFAPGHFSCEWSMFPVHRRYYSAFDRFRYVFSAHYSMCRDGPFGRRCRCAVHSIAFYRVDNKHRQILAHLISTDCSRWQWSHSMRCCTQRNRHRWMNSDRCPTIRWFRDRPRCRRRCVAADSICCYSMINSATKTFASYKRSSSIH